MIASSIPFIVAALFVFLAAYLHVTQVKFKAPDNIQCRLFTIYILLAGLLLVTGVGLSLIVLRLDWLIGITP